MIQSNTNTAGQCQGDPSDLGRSRVRMRCVAKPDTHRNELAPNHRRPRSNTRCSTGTRLHGCGSGQGIAEAYLGAWLGAYPPPEEEPCVASLCCGYYVILITFFNISHSSIFMILLR